MKNKFFVRNAPVILLINVLLLHWIGYLLQLNASKQVEFGVWIVVSGIDTTMAFFSGRFIQQLHSSQKELQRSRQAARTLLNNAGQGFLAFNQSLKINSEFSMECEKILGVNPAQRSFAELVYPKDEGQKEFIAEVLLEFFREEDRAKQEVYLSLLPTEVILHHRHIQLEFRRIQDACEAKPECMVILTDVSDQRNLEKQMEQERKTLQMIVTVVTHKEETQERISNYINFCKTGYLGLIHGSSSLKETITECFRIIHTFKGNFGALEMLNTFENLHGFEREFVALMKKEPVQYEDFLQVMTQANLLEMIEKDTKIIRETLGEDFFKQESILHIDETRLVALEQKVTDLLPRPEDQGLLEEIQKLRYQRIQDLLKKYPNYTLNLAEWLQKRIAPWKVEGEDIYVDPKRFAPLMHSLIHIFHNALDHGLELPEERIDQGKDERGRINCQIKLEDNELSLRIGDDGQGINVEKVKDKAISQKIIDEKTAENLQDSEILNLIFHEKLSTVNQMTRISGRGIGLSAVKRAVDDLQGKIEIYTENGKGTEFRFLLPFTY